MVSELVKEDSKQGEGLFRVRMSSSSTTTSSSTFAQPSVPQFNGEDYDHWSIMMMTLFRFNGLSDVVEKGFSDDESKNLENKQKDAHALYLIQQAV